MSDPRAAPLLDALDRAKRNGIAGFGGRGHVVAGDAGTPTVRVVA